MKSKVAFFLLLTSVLLGGLCIFQRLEINQLKSKTASFQQTVEKQVQKNEDAETKLMEVKRERGRLSFQVETLTAELQALRAAAAQRQASTAAASTPGAASAEQGKEKGGFMDMISKMMDDPNMKKMMRQQQAAMMDMMYGDLFKQLGLTPEETEKFKELLLDRQMKAVDASGAFMKLQGTDTDKTAAMNELAAQQKDFDAQVKAFLGDERYGQYKDYTETMGERMTLNQFTQQLAGGQNPLSADQSGQLLEIMKQENKGAANTFAATTADGSATVANFQNMMSEEKMNEFFKQQEESNQRMLQRASAVLTPEQWQSFSNFQSGQLQMQRMGMTMAVKMFVPQKSEAADSTNEKP